VSNPGLLTIGKLAGQGRANIGTIRYYERRGLMPEPSRSVSGYRLYSSDAVPRLQFIKQAQLLGFSLREIKELLFLRVTPGRSCADVRERAGRKMADVEQPIAQLDRRKHALAKFATVCPGSGPISECPILDVMETRKTIK